MASREPLVGVVIGSKTDDPLIQPTLGVLDDFGIPYELNVLSAHRTPDRVRDYAVSARERGLKVLIAAAGGAAALPGALASWTTLPVIGVPLGTSELRGVDALYAIAQMPPGIPVGCVAVGSWGARNAAHLAAEILALSHPEIERAIADYRARLRGG